MWRCCGPFESPLPFLIVSFCALALFFFLKRKRDAELYRRAFLAGCDLFLILGAMLSCHLYDARNSDSYFARFFNTGPQEVRCTILDLPREGETFFRLKAEANSVQTSQGAVATNGKLLLYVKKPVNEAELQPGGKLRVYGRFSNIPAPLNPQEFDFRSFAADKNIFYQCFTDSGHVIAEGRDSSFSLQRLGLSIRQKVIRAFRSSALSPEAANLCIALLTGYDDDISHETINAFAHSGTLHVLSVSGLHTGILYTVLVFLFGLIDRDKKFRVLQVILILAFLFGFALIAGFSPPVMRAAIMLGLLVIGKTWFDYSSENSFNILAVSAFGMLLFDPLLLFDTGFLLSYLAIGGILFFAQPISGWFDIQNDLLRRIWQLISVSLAAQITTLPLTLYLFHQFPLWFIFSNLLVIPLCTIVMFLGLVVLLKTGIVEPLINLLTKLILLCVGVTDVRGWGYIDGIDFNLKDAIAMSLVIFLLCIFARTRSYRALSAAVVLVIAWQLLSIFEIVPEKNKRVLAVYQLNKNFAMDVKNGPLLLHSSQAGMSDYDFHVKPHHGTLSYPELALLNVDLVRTDAVSLFHLKNNNTASLLKILQPQCLVVSSGADIKPELLKDLKSLKILVADGSNSYRQTEHLSQLCRNFGLQFYSTRTQGYFEIDLDKTL